MQSTAAKSVAASEISWEAAVSAWMDGEEADDIFRGLSRDGRQTWDIYHLIGDALRNAELALTPSAGFHARLSRALDAELPIVAPPPRRRSLLRLRLSGLAAAAAVATVAWVARPYLGGGFPGAETRVLADASLGGGADASGLSDYLEAHRQVAGPSPVRQVSFDIGMGR